MSPKSEKRRPMNLGRKTSIETRTVSDIKLIKLSSGKKNWVYISMKRSEFTVVVCPLSSK